MGCFSVLGLLKQKGSGWFVEIYTRTNNVINQRLRAEVGKFQNFIIRTNLA